ncbi:hypothetical protein QF048_007735, partial [Streptomyces sp. W4I9-2]|nr:hypothetical protein [Streptomyces sp. W4I9-2]
GAGNQALARLEVREFAARIPKGAARLLINRFAVYGYSRFA